MPMIRSAAAAVTPAQRVSEPSDFDPPMHVKYRCGTCGKRGNEIGGRRILVWTRYLWGCPYCGAMNDRPDAPDQAARAAAEEAERRSRAPRLAG